MQGELFDDEMLLASTPLLRYEEHFLSAAEEALLIEVIQSLPFKSAKYKVFPSNRGMPNVCSILTDIWAMPVPAVEEQLRSNLRRLLSSQS